MATEISDDWQNCEFYDCYDGQPMRALSVACLSVAYVEFKRFGEKRHRQWCRKGRDWQLNRAKKNPNWTPPVYQEMLDHIWFLYSRRFGLMVNILGWDLDQTRLAYWKLLAGPVNDG